MNHVAFGNNNTGFQIGLLVKDVIFDTVEMRKYYIDPFEAAGGEPSHVLGWGLPGGQKPSASVMKDSIKAAVRALKHLKITILWVADAGHFKQLTGTSATTARGRVIPAKASKDLGIEEGDFQCVALPNYKQAFYDDRTPDLIKESCLTVIAQQLGTWVEPGKDIIRSEYYPEDILDIRNALIQLHMHDTLAVDIEGFSLRHYEAGVGTIAFAWDEHNGIAFRVDYQPLVQPDEQGHHGTQISNPAIKKLLKEFFMSYHGKILCFNGYGYDLKVLIYELFMKDAGDVPGMLDGLRVFYGNPKKYDDVQVITYLATNSTAGNVLGLKPNAAEFTGHYAEDVTDIRRVPIEALLKYNLIDALATWFVYNKNWPVVLRDQQDIPYNTVFKPSMPAITQAELVGMPMDFKAVARTEIELESIRNKAQTFLKDEPLLKAFRVVLAQKALDKDFANRIGKAKNPDKIKRKTLDQFDDVEFNPNSGPQVGILLHEYFGLPVVDKTDTGLPATGGDSLKKIRVALMSQWKITDEDLQKP